jgi:hypothetical protein
MPLAPRLQQPERPDPAQRLLAAVAEGDAPTARRLGERLVHRLGVEAFARWQREQLLPVQGAGAVQWLCGELGLALPAEQAMPAEEAVPAPEAHAPVPLAPSQALRALPRTQSLQDAAPAPATVRRLRSWLRDLPQAG